MDCSPPGSPVHGDSPGKNTRVGCHAPLRGILLTQGSNPGLPHCRQILSPGKPKTGVGSLSLLQGIFPIQELNRHLLHCRWTLYQLRYQGSPYTSCSATISFLTSTSTTRLLTLQFQYLPQVFQEPKKSTNSPPYWTFKCSILKAHFSKSSTLHFWHLQIWGLSSNFFMQHFKLAVSLSISTSVPLYSL